MELKYLKEVFVLKIRIKFQKYGTMKFIGHLDIMRYFQKAMRRADIDICYTEGYSPHQVMSFAAPLGVGITSDGEYLDIEVHSSNSSKSCMKNLNQVMVDGIKVIDYVKLPEKSPSAMSIVAGADYSVSFREGYEVDFPWEEKFHEFMKQKSITILKKTKKSEKEVDIKPLIYSYGIENGVMHLSLATGSANNLKPELIMDAFGNYLDYKFKPFTFLVHRHEIYANIGEENEINLLPLGNLGERIEE